MVPKSIPFTLDTSTLENFIPGIVKVYGPDKPMKLEIDLKRIGAFDTRKSDQHLSV